MASASHSVYVCCVVVGEQRELTSAVLRSLQGDLLHYGCHAKKNKKIKTWDCRKNREIKVFNRSPGGFVLALLRISRAVRKTMSLEILFYLNVGVGVKERAALSLQVSPFPITISTLHVAGSLPLPPHGANHSSKRGGGAPPPPCMLQRWEQTHICKNGNYCLEVFLCNQRPQRFS